MTVHSLLFILLIFFTATLLSDQAGGCVHNHFASNVTFHYYNDLGQQRRPEVKEGRLLQTNQKVTTPVNGKLRIYADYSFLQTGSLSQKNLIKRIVNISANYIYNTLTVRRLDRLFYPIDSPPQCNILTVPSSYSTVGVIGDLGVLISNEVNPIQYIAKSTACALMKSNNRSIWGVMIWNNNYLESDQVGFQKIVYVGIHQLIHILGYSASMYDKFPNNLYRNDSNGQYLTSPLIVQELNNHFGCTNSFGILLEDQDGTLIPSHNERKVFGNQMMTASGKKNSYMSRATLAILASIGWYNVSFDYAEPSTWGQMKGCSFFQIDNCDSSQFCSGFDFGCDWDVTAIGRCSIDPFTGSCKLYNYFTNTICTDQNYQLKNLNKDLLTQQRGGYYSKCFASNFRGINLAANALNFRCYVSVCSFSKSFLYILVGQSIFVCSTLVQQIYAPSGSGLNGTLRCPMSFDNYCNNKKTCVYGCNRNGACINGQCLCTGSTVLSTVCLNTGLEINQMDISGGLLNSLRLEKDQIQLKNSPKDAKKTSSVNNKQKVEEKDNNSNNKNNNNNKNKEKITKNVNKIDLNSKVDKIEVKAGQGQYFDPIYGQVGDCKRRFNCESCTFVGCIRCPEGTVKIEGRCQQILRL